MGYMTSSEALLSIAGTIGSIIGPEMEDLKPNRDDENNDLS